MRLSGITVPPFGIKGGVFILHLWQVCVFRLFCVIRESRDYFTSSIAQGLITIEQIGIWDIGYSRRQMCRFRSISFIGVFQRSLGSNLALKIPSYLKYHAPSILNTQT
jgi:hypothetical protein